MLTMTPTPSPQHTSAATSHNTFVERLRDRMLRPGRHWIFVSVAMYALACMLPAVGGLGDNPIRGYVCLIAVNDPIIHLYELPYWWANPAYFVAVIASLLNRIRVAVVFAIVAALLAVSYEFIGFYNQGVPSTMKDLLPGCLMWIASLQLLACHELWRQWLEWQQRQDRLERGPMSPCEASPVQSSARQ
jgi:hypothetical protein